MTVGSWGAITVLVGFLLTAIGQAQGGQLNLAVASVLLGLANGAIFWPQ